MMQRHDAFPTEAREKCDTVVFLVLHEGLEVSHKEVRKGEKRQRGGEREETMRFVRLKGERNGRDHIREVCGKEKFSHAAVDETKRGD